jgi:hypothetical protein
MPKSRRLLWIATVTDHREIGDRQMTVLSRILSYTVLFGFILRVFFGAMQSGIVHYTSDPDRVTHMFT